MLKHIVILAVVLFCMQAICSADKYDGGLNGYDSDNKLDNSMIDQEDASQFLKRLFHPFSTKNEEIKRETREVYEEKCESIIPGQR